MSDGAPTLLIAPDLGTRSEVERSLSALGAHVISVPTALEAIGQLPRDRLALIVCTIDGTDMNELVGLARLRELPQGREAPMVALSPTGPALARIRMLATQLGVTEYLPLRPAPNAIYETIKPLLATAPTPEPVVKPAHGKLSEAELKDFHSHLGAMNHFERLDVGTTADTTAIRQAFARRMKRFSPDNMDDPGRESRRLLREVHEELNRAFAQLRTDERRDKYLKDLAASTPTARTARHTVHHDDDIYAVTEETVTPRRPSRVQDEPSVKRRPDPRSAAADPRRPADPRSAAAADPRRPVDPRSAAADPRRPAAPGRASAPPPTSEPSAPAPAPAEHVPETDFHLDLGVPDEPELPAAPEQKLASIEEVWDEIAHEQSEDIVPMDDIFSSDDPAATALGGSERTGGDPDSSWWHTFDGGAEAPPPAQPVTHGVVDEARAAAADAALEARKAALRGDPPPKPAPPVAPPPTAPPAAAPTSFTAPPPRAPAARPHAATPEIASGLLAEAARLQSLLGDHLGAARLLEEALRNAPNDVALRYRYEIASGHHLTKLDRRDDARAHFELAARIAPPNDTEASDALAALNPTAPSRSLLQAILDKKQLKR